MQLIFFLFHYIYQKISACVIMILILGLMSVNTVRRNLILMLIVRYLLTYPIEKADTFSGRIWCYSQLVLTFYLQEMKL